MNENFEIEDDINQEEFEKMLEASLSAKDDFEPGDKVRGLIVNISPEYAFIDIAGKSEAMINTAELYDENGELTVKKGDTIDAYVVSIKRGEVLLTSKIGRGQVSNEVIRMAYANGVPVEGRVTEKIKGGYSVTVSETRCFCPFSQIDINSADDDEAYIGNNFLFRISEYSDRGKNIVLSRRAILEEEKKEKQEELKRRLTLDSRVSGTVSSIQSFGVFVDIDGVQALIPRSELSWERNADPNSFKKGETVSASVIDMDWANNKLTLSIKKLLPDPWTQISAFSEGQLINGKITNIIKTGAFIELSPGLEGFIHISRMGGGKRIAKVEDAVSIGQSVAAKITGINHEQQRISVELIAEEEEQWELQNEMPQTENDSSEGSTLGDIFKDKFAELREKIDK